MAARTVSPTEAHELVQQQGYLYLDVRSEAEVEFGHPAGAWNVPLRDNPRFVETVRARFGTGAKLVVGCASGIRSELACAQLEGAGFTNVVHQRAGFGGKRDAFGRIVEPGWSASGLPCEATPRPGRSHAELRAAE